MFFKNETVSNLFCGVLLLTIELLCVFVLFRNSKIDDRKSNLMQSLLSFSLALPIQLLLGMALLFFPYSAGAGVATLGQVWGAQVGAESHTEVPYYIFIVIFMAKALSMLGLAVLGFTLGKKKLAKERAAILGSRERDNNE